MIWVIILLLLGILLVFLIKKRGKKSIKMSTNCSISNRFCHNCGSEIPQGAKFCPKCGTQVLHNETKKVPKTRNKIDFKRIFDMKDKKKRIIVIICLIIGIIAFVSNLNGVRSSRHSYDDYDYNYNVDKNDDDYDGVYTVDDKHFVIDGSYFSDDSDDDDDDDGYNYGSLNHKAEIHCSSCGGSGRCRSCSGSGKDTVYVAGGTTTTNSCNYCYGSGRCRSCGGDGKQ